MSGPIDIAVDLGAVPESLPPMVQYGDFAAKPEPVPPQIIHGLLHQGGKMILSGTSKSNKTWSLLDLAVSVASGQEWWGNRTQRSRVAYLNFELHPWAIQQRLAALLHARPECTGVHDMLHLWNLRGHNADFSLLRPQLEAELMRHQFGLLILDPIYKLLGNRDENSNSDIADLMNELEQLARRTKAAITFAHHFAKGDSSAKASIDRAAGAGVFARDPDSIKVITPHEEEDCFTVSSTLRNLPKLPDYVMRWDYPLMRLAKDLNPEALRRPQSKNKVCSDREFVETVLGNETRNYKAAIDRARSELSMGESTAKRYLSRLKEGGLIYSSAGLYWSNNKRDANN